MQFRIQFLDGSARVIREMFADARNAVAAIALVADIDWLPPWRHRLSRGEQEHWGRVAVPRIFRTPPVKGGDFRIDGLSPSCPRPRTATAAARHLATLAVAIRYVRYTSTPAVRRVGARFYAPASHCFATNTLNEIQVRHTERLSGRWRPRAVRRGTCRRSSCTGQLARIRARRSSGHLLRGSQSAKNSYPTRSLAERSVPPGVRPPRETMVALDGAVHGQFGGIHCRLRCSSLRRHRYRRL